MKIAGALATLLEVVEKDRTVRCAQILDEARAEVEAMNAAAMGEGRRRLRAALRAGRAEAKSRTEAARAQLEAERRRVGQRRASLALAIAEPLLADALQAAWADPVQRRRWLQQALARAAQSLPRGAWCIRHAPGVSATDRDFMGQSLDEFGVGDASVETDPGIGAGIEIEADAARLDATEVGLLADRAWVHGRLLHLMEQA
ncbi:MAG: hypothetical protein FJY34_12595 [Betaproteobacteria bacterium]|nr:hypothetical protein [Betaproteobacteria bacterium]